MALAAPATHKRLPVFCRKTIICKFNLKGRCTKGPSCNFAHDREEMKAPPDLHRTRLCEALVATGSCPNPDCQFAHDRAELRKFPWNKDSDYPQLEAETPELGAAAQKAGELKSSGVVLSLSDAIAKAGDFDADAASTYLSEASGDPFSRQVSDEASSATTDGLFSRHVSDGVSSTADSEDLGAALCAGPAPPKTKLALQLRKTKMCAFFMEGRCKWGRKCSFAHDHEEVKPKPELARTKMCGNMLRTGRCESHSCLYAHSRDELRPAGEGEGPGASDSAPRDDQPDSGAEDGSPPSTYSIAGAPGGSVSPPSSTSAAPACFIGVKNTFIDVMTVEDEQNRARALERRSGHSAPPRLSREGTGANRPKFASQVKFASQGGNRPSGLNGFDRPDAMDSVHPSTPPGRKSIVQRDLILSFDVPPLASAALPSPTLPAVPAKEMRRN